ncbi:MAG: DNA-protecting protein DprA [Acidimicrobiales bacterium]|nr:DNA-protecting protein DprA [Hyphomonadaceae bacterium]RZV41212.1 MAG: DNA-protecting protein DprA [Acidimicrobiales bacterium]
MEGNLSFSEKCDWLRLSRTPNVGPVAFGELIKRYGDAETALLALPEHLNKFGKKSANSIPDRHLIEQELDALENMGVRLLAACEPEYPAYLKAVDPPPPLISVRGDIGILHEPCVAIIGSRNASAIGLRFARQIASELGEAGYTIVSGMARGIDTSAHNGALETGTAAVLGGGVDHIYPRQNTDLYHAIAQSGALISESPLGYRATARDFPRRNRIISGLSMGVVVIEAAERSGTLITARYALEQNREVLAVPGSPLDPRTKGCNRLIRQGAGLIETSEDIINALTDIVSPGLAEPVNTYVNVKSDWRALEKDIEKAHSILIALCSPTPSPRDEIIRQSSLPFPVAAAALMEMELAGIIHIEGDGRVCLNV